jgi:hypothetical protein
MTGDIFFGTPCICELFPNQRTTNKQKNTKFRQTIDQGSQKHTMQVTGFQEMT